MRTRYSLFSRLSSLPWRDQFFIYYIAITCALPPIAAIANAAGKRISAGYVIVGAAVLIIGGVLTFEPPASWSPRTYLIQLANRFASIQHHFDQLQ